MDWSQFEIGGISVFAFVPGLVQFIKNATGLANKAAEILTVAVGIACVGLSYALNIGIIPQPAITYIELAFVAIGGALAIAGYYKLAAAAGRGFASRLAAQSKRRFE